MFYTIVTHCKGLPIGDTLKMRGRLPLGLFLLASTIIIYMVQIFLLQLFVWNS